MTNSYIALDLETTGLEARLGKITEIAALRVVDGRVEERFVTLVNPGRQLGERITVLTGITDDMVKDRSEGYDWGCGPVLRESAFTGT